MRRRTLLKSALIGTGVMVGTGAAWLTLAPQPPVAGFSDVARLRAALEDWRAAPPPSPSGAFPLAQMLEHCAQSVDMSIDGYPELRAAWFRASVGPLAYRAFDRMGRMRHRLAEPIPGAPPLVATDVRASIDQLEAAFDRFIGWNGPLQPHFAYGVLDHAQYLRAHLMHVANHWPLYAPWPGGVVSS